MACFLLNACKTTVKIPYVEQTENYTVYHINIKVGDIEWKVQHRYNDFVELHEKLVTDNGVAKDILPPKKVIGNRDPAFIEKRRDGLEKYLTTVIHFLQKAMPRELALFLDFHLYDILFLLQNMALQFFIEGDTLLQNSRHYTFSPLQLFAISERLKQPRPAPELLDRRLDFSHVLDFCSQLTSIKVLGSRAAVGTSNIVPSSLPFELSVFRSLESLELAEVPPTNVYGLGALRSSLENLSVNFSGLETLSYALLCDQLHRDPSDARDDQHAWKAVNSANFSHNLLTCVDESVRLLPALEKLNLSHNRITDVNNLTLLPRLSHLDLSVNQLSETGPLHMKVGNIVQLNLSQNCISSLTGFSRLYSLEDLDLSDNRIEHIHEISHICALPCLENLVLIGNPVSIEVDYRVRVFEQFGSRACELCLDNEKATSKELDTAAVLQALRIVKEGRTPTLCIRELPCFPNSP
ncbi:nischarin [Schistocerca piceifrons]|uniref:nischarin n=1 Tax=Schistocerca piceifrons TaxID=274613 RepID=UPI001F5ED0C9|nr:nischarin [Schistocerca piceifrons]